MTQVENVVVEVPFPKAVLNVTLTPSQGKYSFDPVSKMMTWDVGKIDTSKLPNIKGNVSLCVCGWGVWLCTRVQNCVCVCNLCVVCHAISCVCVRETESMHKKSKREKVHVLRLTTER